MSRMNSLRFTAGYTYYNEPERLIELFRAWEKWPSGVDIFLVDDGSPDYPAINIVKKELNLSDYGPTIQVWRVSRDIGFNSHGCRNLIAKYATTDWIAYFDSDVIMYPPDVALLKQVMFNKGSVYYHKCYQRYNQVIDNKQIGHQNVFVVHKDDFWEAGGYDESFTGYHYGDREFLKRLSATTEARESGCRTESTEPGKHGRIMQGLERMKYIGYDESVKNYVYETPLTNEEMDNLAGKKKTQLDFPFIRLL